MLVSLVAKKGVADEGVLCWQNARCSLRIMAFASVVRISFLYVLFVLARGQQFVRECARQAGLPSCVCQTDNGVVDLR